MSELVRYHQDVWEKVRALVESGVSMHEVGSMPDMPTKQAISAKAKREQWVVDADDADGKPPLTAFQPLLRHLLGRDSPEARQKVLDVLAAGGSFELAAALIGMTSQTVRMWRKDDEDFEMQCRIAQGTGLIEPTRTLQAATITDWQAAKYVLERNPITKAAYASPNTALVGGQTTFNVLGQVNVGIAREDDAA